MRQICICNHIPFLIRIQDTVAKMAPTGRTFFSFFLYCWELLSRDYGNARINVDIMFSTVPILVRYPPFSKMLDLELDPS
jgi:hypothetical protein